MSHYELREGYCSIWYIPPYEIICEGKFTTVRKVIVKTHNFSRYEKPRFQYIFKVDEIIHPDTPEKLLARIKLLSLLS